METTKMNYWMYRVSHENGYEIITPEAKRLAQEKGVVLINGPEFAHSLIRTGARG